MNAKLAITLILGLVFQLAQVLPAAVPASPCQTQMESCGCCTGANSCHCAENEDSGQKPAPTPIDTSRILKIPAMKSADTRVSVESLPEAATPAITATSPQTGPVRGFTGVRLSVAFCSFVI